MALMTLSKDGQAWKMGDYVPFNNVWGKGSYVNGTNFTQSVTFDTSSIDGGINFKWNWPLGAQWGVLAYPEIAWGDSPLYDGADECRSYVSKIADLAAFDVDIDIDLGKGSQYLNVSFDVWLTNKPLGDATTITTELMIWLDSTKTPWGDKIATIGSGNDTASVYFVNDVKSGSRIWDYVAVVYDKPHLEGNIDLKAIMDMLAGKGIIDDQDYVSGYHLGAEIQGGSGSLAINRLQTDFRVDDSPNGSPSVPHDKTLVGTAGNDTLLGGAGNDTISGGDGNDIIEGGAGRDKLDGGAGNDTLQYTTSDAGVTVDLAANTAAGGHAAGDTISNFENVTGSAYGDTLYGNSGANIISGLDGNDKIDGRAGNDVISGGAGNDTIEGGAGQDRLDGGSGIDTVEYRTSDVAVVIDLATGSATGGHAAGDTISNFENVTGSAYNDTLYGDAGANVILGLAGADRIEGRGGDDIIDLGAGNDYASGGDGNDTIYGGDGSDRIIGDRGADDIWGGAGGDWSVYRNGDSTLTEMDHIHDFNYAEGDRIDIVNVDADTVTRGYQRFTFIGTSEFSGKAGELRYETKAEGTYILSDTTGDKVADFAILLNHQTKVTADFFVV